jgi:hypothetical protein
MTNANFREEIFRAILSDVEIVNPANPEPKLGRKFFLEKS